MEIHQNLSKSLKMRENLWTSMKIYKTLWKSMKSMNMYGIYLFRKKEMGYILYSKNINASRICPPKRNMLFEQRKWKSRFSGKHGLWPAKYISKSLFWWKSEMIPRSFRSFCPSRFPVKPRQKFSFWQKCWKWVFQKVWDSVWGLYSTIEHTFCGNSDDNSIRTRLAWSREHRIQKIINL